MAKKPVFVSFDYEKDRNYYYTMKMWDANSNFEFVFSDYTSKEIQSDSIPVVKSCLTKKIKEATYTLVIIGKDANKKHKDSEAIGYRNWQNFEIAKSKENGKKLIGVKIDRLYDSPEELYNSRASWAMSFTQQAIIKALNEA
ncbi:MAG: TIR domain-containing protein [Oscillospiraceae bacterium]|nr:TIR domain-containing protein [Oscillospiraceae bacterium]